MDTYLLFDRHSQVTTHRNAGVLGGMFQRQELISVQEDRDIKGSAHLLPLLGRRVIRASWRGKQRPARSHLRLVLPTLRDSVCDKPRMNRRRRNAEIPRNGGLCAKVFQEVVRCHSAHISYN